MKEGSQDASALDCLLPSAFCLLFFCDNLLCVLRLPSSDVKLFSPALPWDVLLDEKEAPCVSPRARRLRVVGSVDCEGRGAATPARAPHGGNGRRAEPPLRRARHAARRRVPARLLR